MVLALWLGTPNKEWFHHGNKIGGFHQDVKTKKESSSFKISTEWKSGTQGQPYKIYQRMEVWRTGATLQDLPDKEWKSGTQGQPYKTLLNGWMDTLCLDGRERMDECEQVINSVDGQKWNRILYVTSSLLNIFLIMACPKFSLLVVSPLALITLMPKACCQCVWSDSWNWELKKKKSLK